jgi:hypothetical protein
MSQAIHDDILVWPCWMPAPQKSNYGVERKNFAKTLQMEIGNVRHVTTDADYSVISCVMILSQSQMAFLEAFERDALCAGREWFVMPVWVGGELKSLRARFNSRPKFGPVQGLHTTAAFDLVIGWRPLPPIDMEPVNQETLVRWPDEMPKLQKDGYGYEITDFTLSNGMDLPGVKRVDFYVDEVSITARMILDQQEAAYLEYFERNILNGGNRWFVMPVWISGEHKDYTVRFKERPKLVEVIGLHSVYSFVLEIEHRELLDPSLVGWLLVMTPDQVYALSVQFHEIVHEKLPGITILPDDILQEIGNGKVPRSS